MRPPPPFARKPAPRGWHEGSPDRMPVPAKAFPDRESWEGCVKELHALGLLDRSQLFSAARGAVDSVDAEAGPATRLICRRYGARKKKGTR